RYTFSDAAPDRLRWDDAYSKDGGHSWHGSWIMEFTRSAALPAWPAPGDPGHTYYTGARCDMAQFREFERLAGAFRGTLRVRTADGAEREATGDLVGYKVLDGCAVLTFLKYQLDGESHQDFSFLTYNTYASAFEDDHLDNRRDTRVHMMYGQQAGNEIVLVTGPDVLPARRHRWNFSDDGSVNLTAEESADGSEWVTRLTSEWKSSQR
ncbi:MAG: hypothetical protein HKM89_01225, partial [Gemmatimonadales bacterium]|nr:hypothetical protein [Gemmatimonadales bacterium]